MTAEPGAVAGVAGARAAALSFLRALDFLDAPRLQSLISDEATVFMPFNDTARRLNGKPEIAAAFAAFFNQVRQDGDVPPYFNLQPDELRVQLFGNVAIVTFHLAAAAITSRRTLMFAFRDHRWRLIHLHCSSQSTDTKMEPAALPRGRSFGVLGAKVGGAGRRAGGSKWSGRFEHRSTASG